MKTTIWIILAATILGAFVSVDSARAQAPSRGRVYIILWFITDDSQLAQGDTAAKRLAAYLTQQGVRATFLVSAEKARALERRNRQDVIGALAQHEIGYYSERLGQGELDANADAGKSMEEWVRRERTDLDEVRRVLGQSPACYGGAEAALSPALYAVLQKWGMKVHFHRGQWAAANGKPFWYEGLLNVFTTRESRQLRPDSGWSNRAEAQARFQDFRFRVSSHREGTLLNVCFRPAEFVQQANPAKEEAARASGGHGPTESPAVKSPEESEKTFSYFESLVTYLKSSSGVEFVTASAALGMLRDTAQRRVYSRVELGDIAKFVEPAVVFQNHEDYILTPSEVFFLLAKSVAGVIRRQTYEPILLDGTPFGPASPPSETAPPTVEVPWDQFASAALEVADYVSKQDQVPDAVRVGNATVSPASFLVALAQVTQILQLKGEPPESVRFGAAHLNVGNYLEGESSGPPGESTTGQGPPQRGPAKLQAWTFKPARFQTQR
jgi:hypothetical protein